VRKLRPFEYHRPRDLAEVLQILAAFGDRARVLAGGTDLLVAMKHRRARPDVVVDLKGVTALDGLTWTSGGGFRMGALWTVESTARSPEIAARLPLLRSAALAIGHPQVRVRATVAGNLCNGSPSADMAPSLLALGARVHIARAGATRVIALDQFYAGPFKTVLRRDEIVTAIEVPGIPARTGAMYAWMPKRNLVDESLVGVAAVVSLDERRRIQEARIGLGAVAPVPIRALMAEDVLRGQMPARALFREAGRLAANAAAPRHRAEYRRELTEVLLTRALEEVTAAI
jgi:aerobic carbon-monoxide dehydrogenase medium subunit